MHQFDAGEGNGSAAEPFEPEHHVHPGFEVAVILLNQVIQVLRGYWRFDLFVRGQGAQAR